MRGRRLSSSINREPAHCRAMNEIAVSTAASVPRTDTDTQSVGRRMLNKVPEVTI
jgi:hypothetical protein